MRHAECGQLVCAVTVLRVWCSLLVTSQRSPARTVMLCMQQQHEQTVSRNCCSYSRGLQAGSIISESCFVVDSSVFRATSVYMVEACNIAA